MIETYRRLKERKAAEEIDGGFTLIELLIVIVVLGILAAVVVFSLGGVSGTSDKAACQSDGASVNTAIAAYLAANPGGTATGGAAGNLVTGTPSYLQSWPSSNAYTITIVGNVAQVTPTGGTATPWTGPAACSAVK